MHLLSENWGAGGVGTGKNTAGARSRCDLAPHSGPEYTAIVQRKVSANAEKQKASADDKVHYSYHSDGHYKATIEDVFKQIDSAKLYTEQAPWKMGWCGPRHENSYLVDAAPWSNFRSVEGNTLYCPPA